MQTAEARTDTTIPALPDFRAECEAFLSQHFARRATTQDTAFVWGQGSDRTAVLEETDEEADRAAIVAVRRWRQLLARHGLSWIAGPEAYGGRGLPLAYQRAFDAAARRYQVPGNGKLTVSIGIVAPMILEFGSEPAKERYLPELHAGTLIGCQLFSEPGAGSDLAAVATAARRDGDGWRLSGQKVWTSVAQFSDIGVAICRTSPEPRHRNLTAFVVDMHAPGVEVRPLRQMTGGAAFNEVFLDDVWVSDEDRLGEVGSGWPVAVRGLAIERTALGDEGFGGAGLFRTDRYVAMLQAVGDPTDGPARQELADLVIHLRVAKYVRRRAVLEHRAGGGLGPAAAIGKLLLSENQRRISDLVSSVLGPRLVADDGEWGTYAWSDFVLGAPAMRLAGGTDEIQRNIIAERVLGLPKG